MSDRCAAERDGAGEADATVTNSRAARLCLGRLSGLFIRPSKNRV